MPSNKFSAVLFDLDGTLLDTLVEIATAANSVLRRRGYPCHKVKAYRRFVGDGVHRLAEQILPEERRSNHQVVQQFAEELAVEYQRRADRLTTIYPGIPELLTTLQDKSISLAILSNKPHLLTIQCANRFLSPWRFQAILGQQASRPRKPDPAGALEIAKRLTIPLHFILYVGDTEVDVQTARAAGITSVGALWGFRSKAELVAHKADFIIETPKQILALLEKKH